MIVGGGNLVDEVEIRDEDNLALVLSLKHLCGEPKEVARLALFLAEVGSEAHRRSSGGHGLCLLPRSNRGQVDGHIAHLNGRGLVCCVYMSDRHRSDLCFVLRELAQSDHDPSVRPL